MYIISETLAGNDPRFHIEMERIFSHWIYTSYYVPDVAKSSVILDNLEMAEVTEEVARSLKFGNVNEGKIGLRSGTLAHDEAFQESTEVSEGKTYYFINENDESNVVTALKTEMSLYLNKHYSLLSPEEYSSLIAKKNEVQTEIRNCTTLLDCQRLMHIRFGLESLKGAQEQYNLGPARFDLSTPDRDNFQ